MKKTAFIFILGVFLPALVLGFLSLRSAGQQNVLIEDQEARLRQSQADSLAAQVAIAVRVEHEQFVRTVEEILAGQDADAVARDFSSIISEAWNRRGIGFSVRNGEELISPTATAAGKEVQAGMRADLVAETQSFIRDNRAFIGGGAVEEVYSTTGESLADVQENLKLRNTFNSAYQSKVMSKKAEVADSEMKKLKESAQQQVAQVQANEPASMLDDDIAGNDGNLPAAPQAVMAPQARSSSMMESSLMPSPSKSRVAESAPAADSPATEASMALDVSTMGKSEGRITQAPQVYQVAPAAADDSSTRQAEESEVEFASRSRDAVRYADSWLSSSGRKEEDAKQDILRKVAPQRVQVSKDAEPVQLVSSLNVANSRFRDLVREGNSGIISRFVEDRLEILFWMRPENRPDLVFGVRILPQDLRTVIEDGVRDGGVDGDNVEAAVLDDRARPFFKFPEANGYTADWAHPFVAAEVGEVLPHWEVGLYLLDAERLTRSARLTSMMILGLIALALGAIAVGGYMVVMDTRRQLELVQKKTDFVSNVSHELKTPLTSIRMFAELLQDNRVKEPEKVSHYLRIITVEAERLTRLINNVLDFARMERNQKTYRKEKLDLHSVINGVWEGQELHLQQAGFTTVWHAESQPYPVLGDADALAQILVNLISNAEKYSGEGREISLHSYLIDNQVRVSVLDRGPGIPAGEEKKVFEHFYRAHDSLANGIQGSGLGLTLAQRIARDHGGDIIYERRKDGGSSFTLQLPLLKEGLS